MKTRKGSAHLLFAIAASVSLICAPCFGQIIRTVAGGGANDGHSALQAELAGPYGAVIDSAGNMYIAETGQNRIRRVDRITGVITTVAGTGRPGFSGDGGPAVAALLAEPRSIAIDASGNLYIADTANDRIRKVDAVTRFISTIAGDGTRTPGGDGGPATAAGLSGPVSIALDAAGNVYVADRRHHQIRRVDAVSNTITTSAGNGSLAFSGDQGPARAAALMYPESIAIDGSGTMYIADAGNHRIRRVDGATQVITTFAGDGTSAFSGDGTAATAAAFSNPTSVAVDADGNVYVNDLGNARIRKIDGATRIVSTIAGTGTIGFSGDRGPAAAATLFHVVSISLDPAGNLYLADAGNGRIRRIDRITTTISTEAGGSGDGVPAPAAILVDPRGVAVDAAGNLYIADTFHHRIRRVDAVTKNITTVAGTGIPGYSGDGGLATSAGLYTPAGLAIDRLGNIFITELDNYRVRRVDKATGVITTIAGGGSSWPGDGGLATAAMIGQPYGVAVDLVGNVYIAATESHSIRVVNGSTGVISRFAGGGSLGDGVLATDSALWYPEGVAVDLHGNVYVAETGAGRIRRVDASSQMITTVAGGGTAGQRGDGGPATAARIWPSGVTIDAAGNLYIADNNENRIRRVDGTSGVISTFAGDGTEDFRGDGGAATTARLARPRATAIDAAGNLYVADTGNNRIRVVTAGAAGSRRRAVGR